MPRAARVCPEPDCANLVRGNARYCPEHTRQRRLVYDATRPSSAQRGYDAEWQRIRAAYLAEHPFCVVCGGQATEVDHIVPIRDGGTHDWDNLDGYCKSHHSAKTASQDGGFGN